MRYTVFIAGAGGQGVLFIGKLLAQTLCSSFDYLTYYPSYGGEMRGGTSNCTVMMSDEEIGSPLASQVDCFICMNQPSYMKFMPLVKENGLVIINSDLVNYEWDNPSIKLVKIPANSIAKETGSEKTINSAILGALAVSVDFIDETALKDAIVAKAPKLSTLNLIAFEKGRCSVPSN